MGSHNIYDKLQNATRPFPADFKGFQTEDGFVLGWGDAAPPSETGWAPGALYIRVGGSASQRLYINDGVSDSVVSSFTVQQALTIDTLDLDSHFTGTTVEAALDEIGDHIQTAQAIIPVPLNSFIEESTGVACVAFNPGAFAIPGIENASEHLAIRWNNHATPNYIKASITKPADMDTSANLVLHISAVRSATDATDLTTFTVTAFDNVIGAAAAADTDFGVTSTAMVDDTNIQELTSTLLAANVSSTQGDITFTIQPTDGLLATVDVSVLGVWFEYTRKFLIA